MSRPHTVIFRSISCPFESFCGPRSLRSIVRLQLEKRLQQPVILSAHSNLSWINVSIMHGGRPQCSLESVLTKNALPKYVVYLLFKYVETFDRYTLFSQRRVRWTLGPIEGISLHCKQNISSMPLVGKTLKRSLI